MRLYIRAHNRGLELMHGLVQAEMACAAAMHGRYCLDRKGHASRSKLDLRVCFVDPVRRVVCVRSMVLPGVVEPQCGRAATGVIELFVVESQVLVCTFVCTSGASTSGKIDVRLGGQHLEPQQLASPGLMQRLVACQGREQYSSTAVTAVQHHADRTAGGNGSGRGSRRRMVTSAAATGGAAGQVFPTQLGTSSQESKRTGNINGAHGRPSAAGAPHSVAGVRSGGASASTSSSLARSTRTSANTGALRSPGSSGGSPQSKHAVPCSPPRLLLSSAIGVRGRGGLSAASLLSLSLPPPSSHPWPCRCPTFLACCFCSCSWRWRCSG
jgi:hypothetical protein